jgi:serine/threonine protein kinase
VGVPSELEYVYNQICQCSRPEQLFGGSNGAPMTKDLLSSIRKNLIKICHPNLYAKNPDALYYADQASSILNALFDEGVKRIESGVYGKDEFENHTGDPISEIKTRKRVYKIYRNLVEGDYANIYYAETEMDGGIKTKVCIKVAKSKSDNDLFQQEISVLKKIKHQSLPTYIEDFKTTDGLQSVVLGYIDGMDLLTIKELKRYAGGVPQEHLCWMMSRLLSVLGFLHLNNTLHCNLEPGNIMIRPRDHNGFLIDLIGSVSNPTGKSKFKIYSENFSPPEALEKKPPVPASDIYSLGKCMVYLAGGDVTRNSLPKGIDPKLREFLFSLIPENVLSRKMDAWECYHELAELRVKLFGTEHQFLPFEI